MRPASKKQRYRILWAVDPFESSSSSLRAAFRALREFARQASIEVHPVYATVGHAYGGSSAAMAAAMRKRGRETLARVTGDCPWIRPLHITRRATSLRGSCGALIALARKLDVDLITLSTHGRRGPRRWVLGSFAESLTELSDVPVLVSPPASAAPVRRRILFATDFSAESGRAFLSVLDRARRSGWGVTIYHRIDFPVYPAWDFGFVLPNTYAQDRKEIIEIQRRAGERLASIARAAGVDAEVKIDESASLNPADGVLKCLRGGYLFVALTARSGVWQRLIYGSTTRHLMRRSPVPVWVFHPRKPGDKRRRGQRKARDGRRGGLKLGDESLLISAGV